MEIERKFLVKSIPDLTGIIPVYIRQGYLKIADPEERVREKRSAKGKSYVHTVKGGYGLCRSETETEISAEEFEKKWPLTKGHRVEKARYKIPYAGLIIELDVYLNKLDGLHVAEVEFDSVEQAENFIPPEWFGRDVTNDAKYKNKNLAC